MVKPSKIYGSKMNLCVLFSLAVVVFLISVVLDIVGAISASSYAQIYNLIADCMLCAVYIFASLTIMIWNPKNIGRTILIAVGVYAAISGLSGAIVSIMNALGTRNYTVPIISAAFSIIQLGISIMGLILIDHKPKATAIITLVSYLIVAINNLINSISLFIYGETLSGIIYLLALFLDIAIVVAPILVLTHKFNDVDQGALAEKKDWKI